MVQYGEPVRPVKEVEAVGMEVSPKGETIIDFGQNLAGVLRVKVDLPAGTKLILDHFETKDSQGNYFNNIAGADMTGHTQTDVYISNGKPAEYRPHFTYSVMIPRSSAMSGSSSAERPRSARKASSISRPSAGRQQPFCAVGSEAGISQ